MMTDNLAFDDASDDMKQLLTHPRTTEMFASELEARRTSERFCTAANVAVGRWREQERVRLTQLRDTSEVLRQRLESERWKEPPRGHGSFFGFLKSPGSSSRRGSARRGS